MEDLKYCVVSYRLHQTEGSIENASVFCNFTSVVEYTGSVLSDPQVCDVKVYTMEEMPTKTAGVF